MVCTNPWNLFTAEQKGKGKSRQQMSDDYTKWKKRKLHPGAPKASKKYGRNARKVGPSTTLSSI